MGRLVVNTVLLVALAAGTATQSAPAQQQAPAASGLESITRALRFRNVGPFRTAAWVTEIAVPEAPIRDHLYTI